jgi:hypothetical protein
LIVAAALPAVGPADVGAPVQDCSAAAWVSDRRPELVRFFFECAEGTPQAEIQLTIADETQSNLQGKRPPSFSKQLQKANAPDAEVGGSCARRSRTIIRCKARQTGRIALRGWLDVGAGNRCTADLVVERLHSEPSDAASGRIFDRKPLGCGHFGGAPLSLARVIQFRNEHGLDLDLNGDHNAIAQRARDRLIAWSIGDPIAKRSAKQWVVPLDWSEYVELNYRIEYNRHDEAAIQAWVDAHAIDSFAGYYIDEAKGGAVYVGFTGDQERQLELLKQGAGLLAPDRVVGFPDPSSYSLRELQALAGEIGDLWDRTAYRRLFHRVGIAVKDNVVEVGTLHVLKATAALAERFGQDAPIRVVYRRPLAPLERPLRRR